MDYDILNDFVSNALVYASSIAFKYQNLRILELKRLIDMPLYEKVKLELTNLLDKENEYYNTFCFNDEEIDYMMSFLEVNYNIDTNTSLESLMHNDCGYNAAYRVYFKLSNLMKNDFYTLEDEIIEKELSCHVKFQKNLLKNYCLVIESFISKYLTTEIDYRDILLYIKYLLPFISSDVEKEFIKEFKFKENLYLDYKMYGDAFLMSDLLQSQYINLQLFYRLVDEINNILKIEDVNFGKSLNEIIVSEIIIKSVSVFFTNDFIDSTLEDLNEHIIRNAVCFSNNQLAVYNIFDLKEITKKDKEQFAYLSLKLPRN